MYINFIRERAKRVAQLWRRMLCSKLFLKIHVFLEVVLSVLCVRSAGELCWFEWPPVRVQSKSKGFGVKRFEEGD